MDKSTSLLSSQINPRIIVSGLNELSPSAGFRFIYFNLSRLFSLSALYFALFCLLEAVFKNVLGGLDPQDVGKSDDMLFELFRLLVSILLTTVLYLFPIVVTASDYVSLKGGLLWSIFKTGFLFLSKASLPILAILIIPVSFNLFYHGRAVSNLFGYVYLSGFLIFSTLALLANLTVWPLRLLVLGQLSYSIACNQVAKALKSSNVFDFSIAKGLNLIFSNLRLTVFIFAVGGYEKFILYNCSYSWLDKFVQIIFLVFVLSFSTACIFGALGLEKPVADSEVEGQFDSWFYGFWGLLIIATGLLLYLFPFLVLAVRYLL